MPSYELNLRDYWHIIKKKKIIVIATIIMLGLFSFIFAMMQRPDPLYQATTSLRIEKASSVYSLYVQSLSWGSGDELATRAEIIKSYPMIEKAAQAMGLLDSSLTSQEIRNNQKYFNIVSRLKARVETEQEGYTNIINIIVTDYKPERARDLANALADIYTMESFKEKNKQTRQSLEAIIKQLYEAEKNMRDSEAKVRRYREQHRFITLTGAAGRLSSQLDRADQELKAIRSDILQTDNMIKEIGRDPELIYYSSIKLLLNKQSPALASIQNQMNILRSKRDRYLQHYTTEHPLVKDIDQQIKNTENRFISELKAFREILIRAEVKAYNNWKDLQNEYKSLPLLGLTLNNLQRELQVNTRLYEEIKLKHQEAIIKQFETVQEVFIVRPAFLPTSPINSSMVGATTAIGTIIGLILGVVLAFVAETLDTTFSTIDDIEKSLDTTVLGIIPFVDIEEIKQKLLSKKTKPEPDDILQMQAQLVSHYNPQSAIAESFRALRTNIHFSLINKGYKTLMVTSSVSKEGKTTVAVNLAISLAQIGLKTLLAETDLRRPRISKLFGIDKEPGLTDVVLHRESLDRAIRTMSDLMMGSMAADTFGENVMPGIEYLNILTAGRHERNSAEILASKFMNEIIDELKESYDIVILDSSPVIQATDPTILGSKVDTCMIVYYQGKISRGTLRRSKNQLETLNADILGVTINGMKADVSADYADYRYIYEKYYSYGERTKKESKGVIPFLKSYFMKPYEGIESTFFRRLNKLKVFTIIGSLFLLIIGGRLIFNLLSSSKPETTTQIIPAGEEEQKVTQPEISTQYSTTAEIPTELMKLRKDLGIDTKITAQPSPQVSPEKTEITPQLTRIPPVSITTDKKPAAYPAVQGSTPVYVHESAQSAYSSDLSQPYSLIIKRESNPNIAKSEVLKLRDKWLSAFITINFSMQNRKEYLICVGSFTSLIEVKKKANELALLGFDDLFEPIKFSHSISLGKFTTEQEAYDRIKELPEIQEFAYIQPSTRNPAEPSEFILLVGAFTSEEATNLFMHTRPELVSGKVLIR